MKTVSVLVLLVAVSLPISAVWAKSKRTPEQILARQAAELGTNRLAKNSEDETGIKLVKIAASLDAENEAALLAIAMLDREQEIKAVKTKYTERKLGSLFVRRGKEIAKKLADNPKLGMACRFYYNAAELLMPDNRDVIIGIAKLERKGHRSDLDTMLELEFSVAEALDVKPPKKESATKKPRRNTPAVKANGFGVGDAETYLEKRYGKPTRKTYIVRPNEYILHYYKGQSYKAYLHFGKCRRVVMGFYYSEETADKLLGAGTAETDPWQKIRDGYWESRNGKFCAVMDNNDGFTVWDKKWYEKEHK